MTSTLTAQTTTGTKPSPSLLAFCATCDNSMIMLPFYEPRVGSVERLSGIHHTFKLHTGAQERTSSQESSKFAFAETETLALVSNSVPSGARYATLVSLPLDPVDLCISVQLRSRIRTFTYSWNTYSADPVAADPPQSLVATATITVDNQLTKHFLPNSAFNMKIAAHWCRGSAMFPPEDVPSKTNSNNNGGLFLNSSDGFVEGIVAYYLPGEDQETTLLIYFSSNVCNLAVVDRKLTEITTNEIETARAQGKSVVTGVFGIGDRRYQYEVRVETPRVRYTPD